jgi:hypothetical protein
LLEHIVRLGLLTPSALPMRKPRGKRPWTPEEIHLLLDRWVSNIHVARIGAEINRSAGGVRSKARRLGLYRRERHAIIKLAVVCTPATQLTVTTVEPTAAAVAIADETDTTVDHAVEREDAAREVHTDLTTPPAETTKPTTSGKRAGKPRQQRIQWTDELDLAVAKRWFAWQCRFGIASDLGISPAAIRTRATRMGLPPRERKKIVNDYVEGRPYDTSLEYSCVKRRCQLGNMTFYGQRNGPHTSPKVMQTKRYKELRRGMAEATLHI